MPLEPICPSDQGLNDTPGRGLSIRGQTRLGIRPSPLHTHPSYNPTYTSTTSLSAPPYSPRGGGTASLRVGTQNKTTDPRFCATTALSHCPCWFTAPCFQGIKGQSIVSILLLPWLAPNRHHFQLSRYNYSYNCSQNANYS